ncbi:MAG: SDR family oxidoreductase [Pseudomonadota bacterium]
MQLNIENKVVVIVGSTRGLGRACASVFAEEGAKLALIARNGDELHAVSSRVKHVHGAAVKCFPGDMTAPEEAPRLIRAIENHYGTVHALINTIGVCNPNPNRDPLSSDLLWEESFQSTLMAAVRSCRSVIPIMQRNGGGAIVNTSAISVRHYSPAIAHYSAMKAAIAHFTKNLAIQYGKDNIRANILLPGWIMSEQVQEIYNQYANRDTLKGKSRAEIFHEMNEDAHRATFGGRAGDPVEYARVAAFLCSDAASYVNGAWMNVDGGSMF